MRAIFIAAGMGTRLRPYTDDRPKCMLPLDGRPVIENNLEHLCANGVSEFGVVVGYKKETIRLRGAEIFENPDYAENNILHSLMYARPFFERSMRDGRDLVVSYSDIIYSDEIVRALVAHREPVVIAVDTDWRRQYEGRTEHPLSEAENVEMAEDDRAIRLGKHIEDDPERRISEFTGLLKLTAEGASAWLEHFDRRSRQLQPDAPFQNAQSYRKAYLCDFLQDLVDDGQPVTCSICAGGWMEFDTVQDYERLLRDYSTVRGSRHDIERDRHSDEDRSRRESSAERADGRSPA